MIDQIQSWEDRLLGRRLEQFKNSPVLQAVIEAFAEQVQALEDSGQAIALIGSIDPVTSDPDSPLYGVGRGAQLRIIGRRIGQQWTGESDDLYRLRLRARIRANKSSGTPEELYAVFVALFAGSGTARIDRADPATLIFRVGMPLDQSTAAVLLDFLRIAKVAGVRLLLEWSTATDAASFAFAGGAGLGFGDSSNSATGGAFSAALQA